MEKLFFLTKKALSVIADLDFPIDARKVDGKLAFAFEGEYLNRLEKIKTLMHTSICEVKDDWSVKLLDFKLDNKQYTFKARAGWYLTPKSWAAQDIINRKEVHTFGWHSETGRFAYLLSEDEAQAHLALHDMEKNQAGNLVPACPCVSEDDVARLELQYISMERFKTLY